MPTIAESQGRADDPEHDAPVRRSAGQSQRSYGAGAIGDVTFAAIDDDLCAAAADGHRKRIGAARLTAATDGSAC